MDLFDIAVAKKLSGGGSSNTVVTITGTADAPFGDINASELREALSDKNASAYIHFDSQTILGRDLDMTLFATALNIRGCYNIISTTPSPGDTTAYSAAWTSNNGSLQELYAFMGGTATDGTAYGSMIPTTLTVVYHQLPT